MTLSNKRKIQINNNRNISKKEKNRIRQQNFRRRKTMIKFQEPNSIVFKNRRLLARLRKKNLMKTIKTGRLNAIDYIT